MVMGGEARARGNVLFVGHAWMKGVETDQQDLPVSFGIAVV